MNDSPYQELKLDPTNELWRAQPEDTIGGWCCTVPASDARTPADGALTVADFVCESDAKHIALVHNEWLNNKKKKANNE